MSITLEELIAAKGGKRKNKINAHKVTIDGITFDSQAEASRYCELKLLLRAGKISNLEVHKKYELIPSQYGYKERYGKNGRRLKDKRFVVERAISYYADFVYHDNESDMEVVEDVKGYRGGAIYEIFKLKRKLMLMLYGINVIEV